MPAIRFYLIMRMVYMFVYHGVEEDIRSDNEDDAGTTATAVTPANGHTAAANGNPRGNGKKSKTT